MQKASYISFLAAFVLLAFNIQTISADEIASEPAKSTQKDIADTGTENKSDTSSVSDNVSTPSKTGSAAAAATAGATATAAPSDSRDQVQAWFAQYDQIRREAEMSMQEKFQAHSLFSKIADEKRPLNVNEKSEEFAIKMMDRYAEAAKKVTDLPELAATAELQKGYEEFFSKSSRLFHHLLSAKKGNEKIATREEVQAKREELTSLDKKIKEMDAKLRTKFSIRAHRHR
jgi:small-conductance mechanosensitive channel